MKKDKKNRSTKKPVTNFVHLQAKRNDQGFVSFEFGGNGQVSCPEAIEGSVSSYSSYKKVSGKEKVVVKSPSSGKSGFQYQRHNLKANYDVIAGIDTNDYVVSGRKISIASSFFSSALLKDDFDAMRFELLPAFIISDIKMDINSEIIGWHLFFNYIVPLLDINSEKRLGLVVDSELGKHAQINKREVAYYRGCQLPQNIGLIYASGERGTDLPNKLVNDCDAASKALYRQIINGELNIPAKLGGQTDDYLGVAYINFEGSAYTIK